MKILEICSFSAGICGVWARVLAESREFVRLGHEVRVFSSDIEKGSGNLAICEEDIESISVRRFKSRSSIISKNVNLFEAEAAISGYGVGLDMTLRDIQNQLKKKGHPWTIAKCFDTSAVISDFMLKENYMLTLSEEISLSVNGVIKQKDQLSKMIFNPAQLVEYISSIMTLEEGDLVFTGTPAGVSKVNRGDKLNAEITGIAKLECDVV